MPAGPRLWRRSRNHCRVPRARILRAGHRHGRWRPFPSSSGRVDRRYVDGPLPRGEPAGVTRLRSGGSDAALLPVVERGILEQQRILLRHRQHGAGRTVAFSVHGRIVRGLRESPQRRQRLDHAPRPRSDVLLSGCRGSDSLRRRELANHAWGGGGGRRLSLARGGPGRGSAWFREGGGSAGRASARGGRRAGSGDPGDRRG